jgi:hypothetical protein
MTLPVFLISFALMIFSCSKEVTNNQIPVATETTVKNQSVVGSKWAGVIMIEGGNSFATTNQLQQKALYRSPLFRVSICIPKNFSSLQAIKIPFADLGFPNLINIPAKNGSWVTVPIPASVPSHLIAKGIFINTDIVSDFSQSEKQAMGRFEYQVSGASEFDQMAPTVLTGLTLKPEIKNYERTMDYLEEDRKTSHYVSLVKRTYVEDDQATTTLPGCDEASSLLNNVVVKKFEGKFTSDASICSVAETKIFNDFTVLAQVVNACGKYTLKD